jgi:hypothetical protein
MNVNKCLYLRPIVNQKTNLSGTWHRTHLETYGPVFISRYFKRAFQLVDIDLRVGMPRGIVGIYQRFGGISGLLVRGGVTTQQTNFGIFAAARIVRV